MSIIVVVANAFLQISCKKKKKKKAYINSDEYSICNQFHQACWERAPYCLVVSASAILSEMERQEFKMTQCSSWNALPSICHGYGCYCECQTTALKILIQMWLNQAHKYEGVGWGEGVGGSVWRCRTERKAEKLQHHPMRKWNIEQRIRKASTGAFFNIQNWIVKIIIVPLLSMSNIVLTSGPSAVHLAERVWRDPTCLWSLCSWYAGSMQTASVLTTFSLSLAARCAQWSLHFPFVCALQRCSHLRAVSAMGHPAASSPQECISRAWQRDSICQDYYRRWNVPDMSQTVWMWSGDHSWPTGLHW